MAVNKQAQIEHLVIQVGDVVGVGIQNIEVFKETLPWGYR